MAVGVGRGEQHAGEELFGLATPELVTGCGVVGAGAGEDRGCGDGAGQGAGGAQRAPGAGGPAGDAERVEHADLAGLLTGVDGGAQQVGLDARHNGRPGS